MSLNHSYTITGDERAELRVNISGLNETDRCTGELSAHIYSICPNTGESIFTCTLTIDQLAGLYSFLSQYNMLKDGSDKRSGEFIQVQKGQEELIA